MSIGMTEGFSLFLPFHSFRRFIIPFKSRELRYDTDWDYIILMKNIDRAELNENKT